MPWYVQTPEPPKLPDWKVPMGRGYPAEQCRAEGLHLVAGVSSRYRC